MENVAANDPLLAFSRMRTNLGSNSLVASLPFKLSKSSNVHVSQSLQLQ